jgi:hypothetical protein
MLTTPLAIAPKAMRRSPEEISDPGLVSTANSNRPSENQTVAAVPLPDYA